MVSGCVQVHTAYIYDRGGNTRLGEIRDIAQLVWHRDRDSISEAEVTIVGDACAEQREFLSGIEPKRHELVIFRGRDRVWEGPVWTVSWGPGEVHIVAHDVLEYLFWRPLTRKWSNAYPNNTLVTTRMQTIINYEMTTDWVIPKTSPITVQAWENLTPPANVLPHLTIHHFPNEAGTSAVTQKFEMSVGEHLAYQARYGGIDFVTVGRAIHIWDTSRNIGETRLLTDADFDSGAIVAAYGSEHTVFGVATSDQGKQGYAASDASFYGPWTKIFSVYNEETTAAPTQADLDSQALRNVSGRNPVPVDVRVPDNSGIRLDETLTIHDLVPGVKVPLLATLNARNISQDQKLDKVRVSETGSGEIVEVVMIPNARPDEDVEE